nr:RNA methyltransferase [Desulfobulbaceae bacterium]
MTKDALNISIVLVEPQGPLNIGSVCRSMANFGFTELRLVNPKADHHSHEARQMAVKATPLLEQAQLFSSIQDAIADCHYSVAVTRRLGGYRSNQANPDQVAQEILPLCAVDKTAIVFGREDHGLFTNELELCQRLLTIPTHDGFPSMNLAQATTVCLYEIYKAQLEQKCDLRKEKKLAPNESLESMLQHMRKTLLDIDYLDPQNPDHILRSFRQIFGRAKLDDREVRILHGLWSKVDWLDNERRKTTNPI